MKASRIFAADDHRKRIVKTKRRADAETKFRFVVLLHPFINRLVLAARSVLSRLLFENRGERGCGVFRIDIDSSGENRLLANESSGQIKPAFDGEMSSGLDDLGEEFSE